MFYWLSSYLAKSYVFFDVFHYISLRSILAVLTSFFLSLFFGEKMIKILNDYQLGQIVRVEGPKSHLKKTGTPTMGGILIILTVGVSTLLWANLQNYFVWVCLFVIFSSSCVGLYDDFVKIKYKNTKGISARLKFGLQSLVALLAATILHLNSPDGLYFAVHLPFFTDLSISLGWFWFVWVLLVTVGSSNAVNLTDGLDGLATLPTIMIATALCLISYLVGHYYFAHYLSLPYIPGAGEVCVFCGAIVGSGLGFLWFNTYPAQVFMGDVGSLGLGAAMGIVAVIIKQEILFMIMSAIFVVETLSVIIQVASFKMTGKRVFKMAPLHHHYEMKGWAEPKIIIRFWIITFMLVLFCLASLKLR
jgi:phospho-N-acetylmuramoyl-pentapeptide-transferase